MLNCSRYSASMFGCLLLINKGSALKIKHRDSDRRWESTFAMESGVKELCRSFSVAQDVGVPNATVDVEGGLSVPRGCVRQSGLVAAVLSDKSLVLPATQRLRFECPFHFTASAEPLREFTNEVFRRAGDRYGRCLSSVIPFRLLPGQYAYSAEGFLAQIHARLAETTESALRRISLLWDSIARGCLWKIDSRYEPSS